MTEPFAVAFGAAVGIYLGHVYAHSRARKELGEASAQAYRDVISALIDLRQAYLDILVSEAAGQARTEAMRVAASTAHTQVHRLITSAGFLLKEEDLDRVATVPEIHSMEIQERMDHVDEVMTMLRQSAYRLFRRI